MGRSPRWLLCVPVLALFLVTAAASAVDVEEVHWGFNGHVVPERINILSVLLRNNTGEDYAGSVRLTREDGVGERRGAELTASVFLAPFTSRWVQFYPYTPIMGETWYLSLSGGRPQELQPLRPDAPGLVYLADPRTALVLRPRVPSMPEDIFPPTVAATDGLSAVVLDHVPRWEPVRRQAFLDWVRRGGIVHLLPGEGGAFPVFTAELAVLNGPDDRARVGSGLVVRHDVALTKVDEQYLTECGFPQAKLVTNQGSYWGGFDGMLLRKLGSIVKPEHAWAAIYLVLFGYLVCLSLVNWLVGRRSRGFLLPTGFFLATVGLTAGLFSFIARRGTAVDETVHTVSYARQIEGTTYDVTQWSNVFARRGDYYRITHPGSLNLYSTCQLFEAVRGQISAAGGGSFSVDIPISSSRGFLHRGRMEAPDLGLRIARWEGLGTLSSQLELDVGPDFPERPERMWAYIGGQFVRLVRQDARLIGSYVPYAGRETFFGGNLLRDSYSPYSPYRAQSDRQDADAVFRGCAMALLAWATGGTEEFRYRVPWNGPGADALDVFVYAPSPPQLHADDIGLGDEAGYVLYHVRLFSSEGTDG